MGDRPGCACGHTIIGSMRSQNSQIVDWWENRRWAYNKAVGLTGILTCALMIVCGLVSEPMMGDPIGIPDPPIFGLIGVIVYGVMANVFYSLGCVAEMRVARLRPGSDTAAFGERAYRMGLRFSIGLTLLPAILCWVEVLYFVLTGKKMVSGASN